MIESKVVEETGWEEMDLLFPLTIESFVGGLIPISDQLFREEWIS